MMVFLPEVGDNKQLFTESSLGGNFECGLIYGIILEPYSWLFVSSMAFTFLQIIVDFVSILIWFNLEYVVGYKSFGIIPLAVLAKSKVAKEREREREELSQMGSEDSAKHNPQKRASISLFTSAASAVANHFGGVRRRSFMSVRVALINHFANEPATHWRTVCGREATEQRWRHWTTWAGGSRSSGARHKPIVPFRRPRSRQHPPADPAQEACP